ncbi:MAG: hypothetical protein ACE5GQ_08795, partial [Nitrospinales bacterium]
KKPIAVICCLLVAVFAAGEVSAHSGHSKPAPKDQNAAAESGASSGKEDSFYAVEGGGAAPVPSGTVSPFSRSDATPRMAGDMGMEHDASEERENTKRAEHQVTLAEHYWVSPLKMVYKAAVGITLLAASVFGILSVKRKEE